MSQTAVVNRFTQLPALAAIKPGNAFRHMLPISLPPSVAIARGNLLIPPSGTGTNDVQTITAPGSLTYTLGGVNPLTGATFTTAALAFGANDAAVAAALNLVLNGPNNTSGPATVTVASLAVTFGGSLASLPVPVMTIASAGSGSPAVAHTTPGVSPGTWTLYAGSGSPTVWLEYDVATDTQGNITIGTLSTGGPWGEKQSSISCYYSGDFFAADIPNLDATALTALKGRILNSQSLATAGTIVHIP